MCIRDSIYAMPYQNNETSTRANTYARFQFWPKFNNDGADGKGLFGITLSQNAGGVFIVTPEAADRFCLEDVYKRQVITITFLSMAVQKRLNTVPA